MVVSPQHRILVGEGGQLTRYFDTPALVPAKALTALPGIRHMQGKHRITWHHFVCDRHEVVTANGCLTESLLLGPMVLRAMNADEIAALTSLYHPADGATHWNGPAARPFMKVSEAARRIGLQKTRKQVEPA